MFNLNFPDGITIFIIFIMLSVLIKNFSRKAQQRNKNAHLPGWYLPLRSILQVVFFLMIISYFFTQKMVLLWAGIGCLVLLDIFHAIFSLVMAMFYKRLESGAAINEQPTLKKDKPFNPQDPETANAVRDIGEILHYPTFSQPVTQNKNTLQPSSNIDHFSNRTGIFVVLFIFMALIFAAAVVYLFFLS